MKYDDLSFTVKYASGEELICDITNVIPNKDNADEPYVTYTDYTLDSENNFREYYGKVTNKNGQSVLTGDLTKYEIAYITDSLKDEIVRYVNDTITGNLEE